MSGIVFDIRHFSVHDGPGIRTTVFLKGCPLKCRWCHNPESQLFETEEMASSQKLGEKLFATNKKVGQKLSVNEVIEEIKKDTLVFDESGGGVTFSGGEPLAQSEFLLELLTICKELDFHTVIDTCGYANESVFYSIAPYTSLFLFDLKLANDNEHKHFTGVSNRLILSNLKAIAERGSNVTIRIPLIPSITDTEKNLAGLRDIISQYPSIKRIDILPFHSIAKGKYERLGRNFDVNVNFKYSNEKLTEIKAFFSEIAETVSVGG